VSEHDIDQLLYDLRLDGSKRRPVTISHTYLREIINGLESTRAENARLRKTNQSLNRRATRAEAACQKTVDDCRSEGVSLGRQLANAQCARLEAENAALRERVDAAERELNSIISGHEMTHEEMSNRPITADKVRAMFDATDRAKEARPMTETTGEMIRQILRQQALSAAYIKAEPGSIQLFGSDDWNECWYCDREIPPGENFAITDMEQRDMQTGQAQSERFQQAVCLDCAPVQRDGKATTNE
jgi:hypothetical protein